MGAFEVILLDFGWQIFGVYKIFKFIQDLEKFNIKICNILYFILMVSYN